MKNSNSGEACAFKVNVDEFQRAMDRLSTMLKVDGIPVDNQCLAVTVDKDKTVLLESGFEGSYASMTIEALEVQKAGWFSTNIIIPAIKYGSENVSFEYDPKEGVVNFKGRISGHFITLGSREAVRNNIPDQLPALTRIDASSLDRVVRSSLFNAELLEGREDVLIRLEVRDLPSEQQVAKKSGIKRKKKAVSVGPGEDAIPKHEIRAIVYDRQRAAVCSEKCFANTTYEPKSFTAPHLWTFLTKVGQGEPEIYFGLGEGVVVLKTSTFYSIAPLSSEPPVSNIVDEVLSQLDESDMLFSFGVNTSNAIEVFNEVTSVRGGPAAKLSPSKDANEARMVMRLEGDKLHLAVRSEIGSAKVKMQVKPLKGQGKVVVNGSFIVEHMALVDPADAILSVWPRMVRMDVPTRHNTVHFFATMRTHGNKE